MHRVLINGFELALYPWLQLYPHDCNISMTCFLLSIERYLLSHGNKLPEVLFLVLDNSRAENKNKWWLCFLALLVMSPSCHLRISCTNTYVHRFG
jgi:hypothetical protein